MERVCCMCGDVGFSDKLFRCGHCRNRFQHSYCSNYYSEFAEPSELCDWCRSDDRKTKHGGGGSKNASSEYSSSSSGGIKHNQVVKSSSVAAGPGGGGGVPSPRTATRRYKLLKDVMC